jgi:hypothetical protein
MLEEEVTAQFKDLSRNTPTSTEENYEKSQLEKTLTRPVEALCYKAEGREFESR